MKKFKNVLALALIFSAAQSFAMGQKLHHVDENPDQLMKVAEVVNTDTMAQLEKLQNEMVERFSQVEGLLNENKTAQALAGAKWILDTVRVKTGIDPKVRIQNKFLIPTVFPQGAGNLSSLSDSQRDLVIQSIAKYQGGLYIDLINLSKRTTLLYVKALMAEMKKQGGINIEDRNKIISDLTKATLIPMQLVDKEGKDMMVLEEDVANEDHVYMFNREIKMFLISSKELSINEDGFMTYKNRVRAQYTQTLKVNPIQVCFDAAGKFEYVNGRESARHSCFDNGLRSMSSMSECERYVGKFEFSNNRENIRLQCYNKFIK